MNPVTPTPKVFETYDNIDDKTESLLMHLPAMTSEKRPKEGALVQHISTVWHSRFLWVLSAPLSEMKAIGVESLFPELGTCSLPPPLFAANLP
jgi:hypothetical protein